MRVRLLSTATTTKLIVFILLVFVSVGDLFLPEPLKSASKETKSAINDIVVGMLPKKKLANPHERTEKAVEEFEKGVKDGQK